MNPPIPTTTPFERSRVRTRPKHCPHSLHAPASLCAPAYATLDEGDDDDVDDEDEDGGGNDNSASLTAAVSAAPFAAAPVSTIPDLLSPPMHPSSVESAHHLPIEVWSLIVTKVAQSKATDPKWRLNLARLAHTCRSAYFAAFPVLWSHLHLQFVRNNTELAPAESTIANAAEYHDDPHLEYRLNWIRQARRQFDAGMVLPSACTRTNRDILTRMAPISECLLLAPLVIHQGMPYLVSLAANEECRGGDLLKIRASIDRLWGPFLANDSDVLDRISIINDLVLVPYPLHLVKHIAINDLDTSVDLGVDLLYPSTLQIHPQKPTTNTPIRKPSWSHVLPFLLQLPPANIHSIRFLTSSPSASRLKAELVHRYQWAHDLDVAYSGDHEHKFSSMTPNMRTVRLFLDGDLDSAASTAPDLFICASPDPTPAVAVRHGRFAPLANASTIEYRGRTAYLPFDEPPAGLHDLFTIPTLTSLVLDVDFDYDANDAGSFPIRLPNLVQFTLTMRIAKLIFSQNQHMLGGPPHTHPGFPALLDLILLNDLECTHAPAARRVPVIPRIPFAHMPVLDSLSVPATFRDLPAPCALDMTRSDPLAVRHTSLPNVVFLGAHMLAHVKDLRPPICDSLVATSKRIEAQYAMRALAFPNLVSVGLHVWGWQGEPERELGECTWREQIEALKVVFDGPRAWGAEWMMGVGAFSRVARLTIEQSVATREVVRLAPCAAVVMPSVEALTVRFPNAPALDFAGVAIGDHTATSSGLHLPKLRSLVVQAPATANQPPVAHLARLVRITVEGAPCPRLIASVLTAASMSQVHVVFDAGPDARHDLAGPPSVDPSPPVVFAFTARNRRVWHSLLTAAAVAASTSAVVVHVLDRLDVVDARTIVRVMRRLLGDQCRMGISRVSVRVDGRVDAESLENAQWVADQVGGGQAIVVVE